MRTRRIAELTMVNMRQEGTLPPDDLSKALRDIVFRPVKTLVPPWSWKAAALTAVLRGISFFFDNLKAGQQSTLQPTLGPLG